MNQEDFMPFLKVNYPHLYDIEMKIRKVQDQTGFGDVSASITIRMNKVVSCQIGEFYNTKYEKKMTI